MEIFAAFILFAVFAVSALEKPDVSLLTAKFGKWYGGKMSNAICSDRSQSDSALVKDYRFNFKEESDFDHAKFASLGSEEAIYNPGKFKIKDDYKIGLKI